MHSEGARAFDFLHGNWTVDHRRLKLRLARCTEWERFSGHTQVWPLLGGHGNVDDNRIDLPSGSYHAVTIRSFDTASGQWSIWWLDGRSPRELDVPMRGGFVGGIGRFHAEDRFKGRPIRVRFVWSGITAFDCRWEQAFSDDDGASWETNWVMDFRRTGGT